MLLAYAGATGPFARLTAAASTRRSGSAAGSAGAAHAGSHAAAVQRHGAAKTREPQVYCLDRRRRLNKLAILRRWLFFKLRGHRSFVVYERMLGGRDSPGHSEEINGGTDEGAGCGLNRPDGPRPPYINIYVNI